MNNITKELCGKTIATGLLGMAAGAAATGAAFLAGFMVSAAILPVAVFSGVSVAVSCFVKPLFEDASWFGAEHNLRGYLGRFCRIALSLAAGIGAATLLGLAITSIPMALLVTVLLVGIFVLFGYLTGIHLPTVINPSFSYGARA